MYYNHICLTVLDKLCFVNFAENYFFQHDLFFLKGEWRIGVLQSSVELPVFVFVFSLDDVYRSNIAIPRPLSCPMHGHVIFQIIFENTEIFNIAWSHTQCPPQRLRPWPVKSGKNNNSGIMYWISSSIESKKKPRSWRGRVSIIYRPCPYEVPAHAQDFDSRRTKLSSSFLRMTKAESVSNTVDHTRRFLSFRNLSTLECSWGRLDFLLLVSGTRRWGGL